MGLYLVVVGTRVCVCMYTVGCLALECRRECSSLSGGCSSGEERAFPICTCTLTYRRVSLDLEGARRKIIFSLCLRRDPSGDASRVSPEEKKFPALSAALVSSLFVSFPGTYAAIAPTVYRTTARDSRPLG